MKAFRIRIRTVLALLSWMALLASGISAQEARLGNNVRPTEQKIELQVDPSQEGFSGRTEIAVTLEKDADSIRLHAQDITVESARLVSGEVQLLLTVKSSQDGTVELASGKKPIPAGSHHLLLEFSGPFNQRSSGPYKYTDQGVPYVSTQFEMSHARLCFPSFDEPGFKIPFQLTILAPKDQKVYSNTPEEKSTAKDGWLVHQFEPTPPMPSYLVAFAVGPFEEVEVPGLFVPGRIVTPKGKLALSGYAQKVTPPILDALQGYFGIDYPYKKLDQIAITEFPHGAMENAGMVTYREDILLINERTAQEDARTVTCVVIAHELAHQWFGNLVTMKWWNDLWLNEAFATWMANKTVIDLFPELEYQLKMPQNRVLALDANLSTKPIRKPIRNEADIFDGLSLAYSKGSSVLNMVERWLGERTFRAGIRSYLNKHRFGNAEAADLWNALGAASDKDVESVLKSFTEQSGYPMVSAVQVAKSLRISQRRFVNAGVTAPNQLWTLPVFVRYGNGEKTAVATVLLDTVSSSVELEFEPDWIFPDDGAVGYFRWELPKPELQALLAHKDQLSPREKLALIYNLGGLFKAGSISAGENVAYVSAFLKDEHPSVVHLALASIDSNRSLFVNDANQKLWEDYLRASLEPVVNRFGLVTDEGEHPKVKELRPLVLRMLGEDIKDPSVIETAHRAAEKYLAGSNDVDPALADVYLLIAARHGDLAMVKRVKEAMLGASDPQRRTTLLTTLGMFSQEEAHQAALDLMLDEAVTASDLRTLMRENSQSEERRERFFDWLQDNYPALSEKVPTPFLANIPASVGQVDDQEKLDAVLSFFSKQPDTTGAIGRETAKIQEQATAHFATREREQKSFDAYLKGTVGR